MSGLLERRLRIYQADRTTVLTTITSVRGDTAPYIAKDGVSGDGTGFDPSTMETTVGAYTVKIVDWDVGAMRRIMTQYLEDPTTGKPQLGFRRAVLDERVDGGTWTNLIDGLLTLVRLINAANFEVTISDVMQAMDNVQLFGATPETSIASFLATFPNRGCILGGPIMGSFLNVRDMGGWAMKVQSLGNGQYYLLPQRVYGPPNWKPDDKLENVMDQINDIAADLSFPMSDGAPDAWTTINDVLTHAWAFYGLIYLIDGVPFKPLVASYGASVDENGQKTYNIPLLINSAGGKQWLKVQSDGTRTLTNGSTVRVRALSLLPSEASPIYLSGHPLTLISNALTLSGIAWNAASFAMVSADPRLGTDAKMSFRITDVMSLKAFVNEICKIWGIGLRNDGAGQIEPFIGRAFLNTIPLLTITDLDIIGKSVSLPYELDPSQAIRSVIFRQNSFYPQPIVARPNDNRVVDSVITRESSLQMDNPDTNAIAFGKVEFATMGMVHTNNSHYPTPGAFLRTLASTLFDRIGSGATACELTVARGVGLDTLNIGDEVLVDIAQLPNHNYRLGDNPAISARAMQVVRRTISALGFKLRLVDCGPNASPLATVPTLSLAASTELPRTVAYVTITNAAALNALGYAVRLQWANGTSATSAMSDVLTFAPGAIPTTPVILPGVVAGSTVYVRARSEGVPTSRPSNYSASVHLALSAVDDPTGLSATPNGSDSSRATLAWTPGANATDDMTILWVRANGTAFSAAVQAGLVNAGSTSFVLQNLAAGTTYIASVQHRDPRTGDLSDPVDTAPFTTSGVSVTLPAPLFPTGFAGNRDQRAGVPQVDGVYGIAVLMTRVPSYLEVAEAVETAPGSGTYGAYAIVSSSTPAKSGDWTVYATVAPNDGLHRKLKARCVLDGYVTSAYTAEVIVLPWVMQPLVGFGAPQGTVTIDSDGSSYFNEDGPATQASARWAASSSAFPNDDTTAASGTLVSGRTIPQTPTGVPLTFGQTVFLTIIPFDNFGVRMPSIHLQGSYQSFNATKTSVWAASGFSEVNLSKIGFTVDSSGNLVNGPDPAGTSSGSEQFYGQRIALPEGVEITDVLLDMFIVAGLGSPSSVTLEVDRLESSASTNLGSDSSSTTGAWVTAHVVLTENVTSGRTYQFVFHVHFASATIISGRAKAGNLSVTYITPYPDKTI